MNTEITAGIKKTKQMLSLIFCLIALVITPTLIYLGHKPIALGIILGFCIGSINLSLLIWTGTKILSAPAPKAHSFSMFMSIARVVFFAVAIGIILMKKTIDPISCIITAYLTYQLLAFKEVYSYFKRK